MCVSIVDYVSTILGVKEWNRLIEDLGKLVKSESLIRLLPTGNFSLISNLNNSSSSTTSILTSMYPPSTAKSSLQATTKQLQNTVGRNLFELSNTTAKGLNLKVSTNNIQSLKWKDLFNIKYVDFI